ADRTLRKLSLRKISARLKKTKRPPRPGRSQRSARVSTVARLARGVRTRAVVLGEICVRAGAVLIAARQPTHRSDLTNAGAPDVTAASDQRVMARIPTTKSAASSMTPTAAPATASAGGSIENPVARKSPQTTALGSAPSPGLAGSTTKASAVESTPAATAPESAPEADSQSAPPVTITGCLEREADTFWLKDTSGTDAPKSRSWRSGFLKRHSVSIELVDVTHTLKLLNYVGQRVAATGMLMNREMRTRALQRVASSCA